MGKKLLQAFRTDSILGNLPQERQNEIAQFYMTVKSGDRTEKTRQYLAKFGITVCRNTLRRSKGEGRNGISSAPAL